MSKIESNSQRHRLRLRFLPCWLLSLGCQRSKAIHNTIWLYRNLENVGCYLLDVKDRKQFTTDCLMEGEWCQLVVISWMSKIESNSQQIGESWVVTESLVVISWMSKIESNSQRKLLYLYGNCCWLLSLGCQRSKAIHNRIWHWGFQHPVGCYLLDVKDRKQFTTQVWTIKFNGMLVVISWMSKIESNSQLP